jgi:hypothetical protein
MNRPLYDLPSESIAESAASWAGRAEPEDDVVRTIGGALVMVPEVGRVLALPVEVEPVGVGAPTTTAAAAEGEDEPDPPAGEVAEPAEAGGAARRAPAVRKAGAAVFAAARYW